LLPRAAEGGSPARRRPAGGTAGDVTGQALVGPVLLGGVRPAGRVEIGVGARTGLCALILGAAAAAASAQPLEEATPLEKGSMLAREIDGGETHRYRLALGSGDFVRVVVEQRGVNV